MRSLSYSFALLLAAGSVLFACKKHNNNPDTGSLLQHKWQIISLNGEALRYVGQPADYFNFGNNDTLIEFAGGRYDTATYQLLNNGHSLEIYLINGGVSTGQLNLNILTLTDTRLILSGTGSIPTVNTLDSLSR